MLNTQEEEDEEPGGKEEDDCEKALEDEDVSDSDNEDINDSDSSSIDEDIDALSSLNEEVYILYVYNCIWEMFAHLDIYMYMTGWEIRALEKQWFTCIHVDQLLLGI